ncbi:MAG: hypothetical protein AAB371_00310 [Patescibacteria group bacterium]
MAQQILLSSSIGIFLARTLIFVGLFLKSIEFFTKNNIVEKIDEKKKTAIKQLSIMNSAPVEIVKEKAEKQRKKITPEKLRQPFTKKNLLAWIYFFSSLLIFTGFFIKLISILWIIFLIAKFKKEPISESIFLLAFFILILFTGAGSLSIDKILRYS